jgi:hypothetical protein
MEDADLLVGDVVTRMGDDRQLVVAVGGYNDVTVECFVAPKDGWCAVGDRELNLAARYLLICRDHDWIDVTTVADRFPKRRCVQCGVEQELTIVSG